MKTKNKALFREAKIAFDHQDYKTAVKKYELSYEILQRTAPKDHAELCVACNNIGASYFMRAEQLQFDPTEYIICWSQAKEYYLKSKRHDPNNFQRCQKVDAKLQEIERQAQNIFIKPSDQANLTSQKGDFETAVRHQKENYKELKKRSLTNTELAKVISRELGLNYFAWSEQLINKPSKQKECLEKALKFL